MAVNVRRGGGKESVEAPSERIIAAANKIEYVITASNVRLGVRKLGALDEMRVTRAVGAADAGNSQYMLWCMMAASIAEIDGDQLALPETQLEFEAVIQRLGDDGVSALIAHTERKFAALTVGNKKKRGGGTATDAEAQYAESVKK